MRTGTHFLLAIGITVLTSSSAWAQYTYDVGPNYVNQSGASCRADTETTEKAKLVNHLASSTATSGSTTGTVRLFCPLNQRGHSFYGNPGGNLDNELTVNVPSVTVKAYDNHTGSKLGCFAYRLNYPTGSQAFGTTKYVCATDGGCSSTAVADSFRGANNLSLPFPSPTTATTVNFGYICDAKTASAIFYAEAAITPNP